MSSVRLGRILGVPVSLHWTLLGALGALVLIGLDSPRKESFAHWALLVSALAALLLHELGHALTARLIGVRVGGVVLHIFGGLTLLDPRALRGWRQVAAASGGPAVNLALGLLALVPEPGLARFGQINLLFGGVNLLPAWPLDGGRIAAALLAYRMSRLAATLVVGIAGLVLHAVTFVVLLFVGQPLFLLVPIYLGFVGLRALQAELTTEVAVRLEQAQTPGPETGAGGTETRDEPVSDKPSLARRLGRFKGSLAEYLQGRRR